MIEAAMCCVAQPSEVYRIDVDPELIEVLNDLHGRVPSRDGGYGGYTSTSTRY